MVRTWRPGGGERIQAGELSVRTFGAGERVFVLLHGITASADIWGAAWDELGRAGRVVVPDLLGFGRSMDEHRSDFSLEAHLSALDGMHAALELDTGPLTVVGHSLEQHVDELLPRGARQLHPPPTPGQPELAAADHQLERQQHRDAQLR